MRVAQPQRTDLILLSPAAWDKGMHTYTPASFHRLIAHEVAHIIEEYLSPNIEAVPRWWSEGLAMYTSGQWQERETLQKVLSMVEANALPSISQMQDGAVAAIPGDHLLNRQVRDGVFPFPAAFRGVCPL